MIQAHLLELNCTSFSCWPLTCNCFQSNGQRMLNLTWLMCISVVVFSQYLLWIKPHNNRSHAWYSISACPYWYVPSFVCMISPHCIWFWCCPMCDNVILSTCHSDVHPSVLAVAMLMWSSSMLTFRKVYSHWTSVVEATRKLRSLLISSQYLYCCVSSNHITPQTAATLLVLGHHLEMKCTGDQAVH